MALRAAGPLVFPIDNKGVETVPTLSLVLPVAVWPDRADRFNLERALQMHPDAGVDVPGIEVAAVRQDPPVLKGLMAGDGHGQIRNARRGSPHMDDQAWGIIVAGLGQVDLVAVP